MTTATTYEINRKCGHTESRDLSDIPAGRRAGRIAWLSDGNCFECHRKSGKRELSKKVKAERTALHEEALADQERSQLAPLNGSDLQIAWAIDARYKLLRDAYDDLVHSGEMDEEGFETSVLSVARRIDSAKWWIDNREATSTSLIELLDDPGVDLMENPF